MALEERRERRAGPAPKAIINRRLLDVKFEMAAKHSLNVGDIVKVVHTVDAQTMIERDPVPSTKETAETEYITIEGQSMVTYLGPAYDHWSSWVYLRFLYDGIVVHYNYQKIHQAGDNLFGGTFVKVLAMPGVVPIPGALTPPNPEENSEGEAT